jgi:hypothetical protein
MKSLVREQFLDLFWDATHLDASAELWLGLYQVAAPKYGYSNRPSFTLELRLSGFSSSEGETLQSELESRAKVLNVPNPIIKCPGSDTLVYSSGLLSDPSLLPHSLGLPLLAVPLAQGLVVEMRFNLRGRKQGGGIRASANSGVFWRSGFLNRFSLARRGQRPQHACTDGPVTWETPDCPSVKSGPRSTRTQRVRRTAGTGMHRRSVQKSILAEGNRLRDAAGVGGLHRSDDPQ